MEKTSKISKEKEEMEALLIEDLKRYTLERTADLVRDEQEENFSLSLKCLEVLAMLDAMSDNSLVGFLIKRGGF